MGRERRIEIRISDAEFERWREAAHLDRSSLSAWIRACCNTAGDARQLDGGGTNARLDAIESHVSMLSLSLSAHLSGPK